MFVDVRVTPVHLMCRLVTVSGFHQLLNLRRRRWCFVTNHSLLQRIRYRFRFHCCRVHQDILCIGCKQQTICLLRPTWSGHLIWSSANVCHVISYTELAIDMIRPVERWFDLTSWWYQKWCILWNELIYKFGKSGHICKRMVPEGWL